MSTANASLEPATRTSASDRPPRALVTTALHEEPMVWDGPSIAEYVARVLPQLTPTGPAQPLPGGLLNHVWRVPARPYSVIVKHAPEHIATQPDVPMSASRSDMEAEALARFGPRLGLLHVPNLFHADTHHKLLIMEDVVGAQHVGEVLQSSDEQELPREEDGALIGEAIAQLHHQTFDPQAASAHARALRNMPVQQTRHQLQYRPVAQRLAAIGIPDAAALGARVEDLGQRLLEPGVCVVMGDLWPRSVLRDGHDEWSLIDWEFAHFGRPIQDVAHFDAHLWMWAQRAPTAHARASAALLRQGFRAGYLHATTELRRHPCMATFTADWSTHFAAELLARTLGPFQAGYLYDGLSPEHPAMRQAIDMAVGALRAG